MNHLNEAKAKTHLLLGIAAAVVVAVIAVGITYGYQAWETLQMMDGVRESLLRQTKQAERREAEAAFKDATSDFAESIYLVIQDSLNSMAQARSQALTGKARLTTLKERAIEVGAPVEAFLDQPVTLLVLESPVVVPGFDVGNRNDVLVKSISVIRIPDGLASEGETASIEFDGAVCWPSDISGMLWDLDATNQEAVRVAPRS